MHSRVFQLEKKEDTVIYSPLVESDLEEGFVGSVADYVSESAEREVDINWLLEAFEGFEEHFVVRRIQPDNIYDNITFKKTFKQAYYKERLDKLKEYVANLEIKEFVEWVCPYKLSAIAGSEYDFYIYSQEDGYSKLDSFIRNLDNKEDSTYYFGNTIDYHC